MRHLFHLLQGHVERRDGVRDQTLETEEREGKKTNKHQETLGATVTPTRSLQALPGGRTSGGVFAGGVPSEVLEEALEGEGLTDSFEFLSASVAPRPFTWGHKHGRQRGVPGPATGGQTVTKIKALTLFNTFI